MKTHTEERGLQLYVEYEEYLQAVSALELCAIKLTEAGSDVHLLDRFRRKLQNAWDMGFLA